jgi:hypothetical protein
MDQSSFNAPIPLASRNSVSLDVIREAKCKLNVEFDELLPEVPYVSVPCRLSVAGCHMVPWRTRRTSAHPPPSKLFSQKYCDAVKVIGEIVTTRSESGATHNLSKVTQTYDKRSTCVGRHLSSQLHLSYLARWTKKILGTCNIQELVIPQLSRQNSWLHGLTCALRSETPPHINVMKVHTKKGN